MRIGCRTLPLQGGRERKSGFCPLCMFFILRVQLWGGSGGGGDDGGGVILVVDLVWSAYWLILSIIKLPINFTV